jgi:molecular chaperone HscB
MTPDFFQRLGLPRRFAVDADELERAYLARSRAVHPDYHLAASASELAASLELAAALNEAYNTLRDPFARAEYLLTLDGGPSAGEHKQMPAAFLAEMLEAREEVERARGNPAEVARLDAEFGGRFTAILGDVGQLLDRAAASPEGELREKLLSQIRALLNAAKYVRGLIRDLHAD